MGLLNFDGETNDITPRQLEFISEVLEKRGYKTETVSIQSVGKTGDNFVANVKRITVKKDGEVFNMIAKVAPQNEAVRANMSTLVLFMNEHTMYTEVLPKFAELEKLADVPENERLHFAECYGSLSEAPHEVILLEDLNDSNYAMLDKMTSLTDKSVRLVLKNFAILHTCSFYLKKQEPETFAAFANKLINTWVLMADIKETAIYFSQLETDVIDMLQSDKYKQACKGTVSQIAKNSVKNNNIDKVSKYSIIQQGDSWTNNIMFQMQGTNPLACCMIDYQLSKESSPVGDIHYMIFNCTDYETRSKHYHDWIDYYHSELDRSLANFGLKANYVYPRDQLDADLRRYGKLSFGLSIVLCSVLLRETADAIDMKAALASDDMESMINASRLSNVVGKSAERVKERLEGLIDSFLELGYL